MMRIASVQVGRPRTYAAPEGTRGDTWTSAIAKQPVAVPLRLGTEGLSGDEQADRKSHGGPHKAALVYAAAHYPDWARELGRELPHGGFGENFTVAGAGESEVCIGDRWQIGSALVEVSQPREPCRNPALYWRIPGLDQFMRDTGRTGWYVRVLAPGEVATGDAIVRLARPCPDWTVARVNQVFYRQDDFRVLEALRPAMLALAALAQLSPGWRARFARSAASLATQPPPRFPDGAEAV